MNKSILIYLKIAILSGVIQINGILQAAEPAPAKKEAPAAPEAEAERDAMMAYVPPGKGPERTADEIAIAQAIITSLPWFPKRLTQIISQYAIFTPEAIAAATELLFEGVTANNEYQVEQALKTGANINAKQPGSGNTPLTMAAYWKRPIMIEILLNARATVDSKNRIGATALNYVSKYGNLAGTSEIMGLLLDAGADVHYECENFRSFDSYVQEKNAVHVKVYQDHLARVAQKAAQAALAQ